MTNVINEMKTEGYEITAEMLNGLSPYHTGHLNRFGLFPLTGSREKLRVEFKLNLKQTGNGPFRQDPGRTSSNKTFSDFEGLEKTLVATPTKENKFIAELRLSPLH
ncbi:TPA: hypothetical protein ACPSKB_000046 [Legionella feeleii]